MKSLKKLLVAIAAIVLPVTAFSQVGVGSWVLHAPFSGVSDMVDTPNKIYYNSNGTLFSYDKQKDETYCWNVSNKLNSSGVTGMFYNKAKKYLAVTFSDSNIDLIYDNGKVSNLSDIKDAMMTEDKSINHVAFGKERMYVATAFGLVVFNDKKCEVIESANYGAPVTKVAVVDGYLVIQINNELRFIKEGEKIISLAKFDKFDSPFANRVDIIGLGEGNVMLNLIKGDKSANQLIKTQLDFVNKTYINEYIKAPDNSNVTYVTKFMPYKDGVLGVSKNCLYFINEDEDIAPILVSIPSSIQNLIYGSWDGAKSVWVGKTTGAEEYDLSGSTPVQTHAAITGSEVRPDKIFQLYVSPSNKIYAVNADACRIAGYISSMACSLLLNIIEDGKLTSMDPPGLPKQLYNESIVEDPDDPNTFYIGTRAYGVYVITNGQIVKKYDSSNAPIKNHGAYYRGHVNIDGVGNMWVYNDGSYAKNRYLMLPAAKRRLKNPVKEDWLEFNPSENVGLGYTHSFAAKIKNVMFIPNKPHWSKEIFVYNHNGTESLSDDRWSYVTQYIDQDGKALEFNHIGCFAEDKLGRIWVGTDDGIFEITDANAINGSSVDVNHLKVPRNDGTGLADYLLGSQTVLGISVDSANRKWIATYDAGVYLVSPDGDEILEHYTGENSLLPADKVLSVACDPLSNRVYFGTEYGLVEYLSTSAPAQDNFDNVYAYPNPVRPDYTGWITITGLMDNSLVKITDAQGNLVHQDKSQGGMLTWNGCNADGTRVKTGVYYVFASLENGSDAVVTKILVVK